MESGTIGDLLVCIRREFVTEQAVAIARSNRWPDYSPMVLNEWNWTRHGKKQKKSLSNTTVNRILPLEIVIYIPAVVTLKINILNSTCWLCECTSGLIIVSNFMAEVYVMANACPLVRISSPLFPFLYSSAPTNTNKNYFGGNQHLLQLERGHLPRSTHVGQSFPIFRYLTLSPLRLYTSQVRGGI